MNNLNESVEKVNNGRLARFEAINGLRAFSAIGILMMHVQSNANYQISGFVYDELIPSFTNLVFLFMIISSFGMCCGYYEKIINQKISFEEFYRKRYAKIWPFFALLCIIDLIISPSLNSLYEVFANLTLCFGLLPNVNMSVIGVGWFLGTVFVFYLVFPFFCYLISNKWRAWSSLIIALIFNYISDVYFNVGRSNIVYSAVFFLAGGLVYVYRDMLVKLSKKFRWILLVLCLLFTISYYIFEVSVPMIAILYSGYLIYAIGIDKRGILENRVTKFISGISMEIYLSHMLIFRALEKGNMIQIFGNGIFSYVAVCCLVLGGTIIFALVINTFFTMFNKLWQRK